MPTEKSCRDSLFGLLKATAPLSDTDKHLIRKELKNTSQLIAYFLWRSTSISTDKIETIFNNLIDLDAFDKITLNQTFSQKFLDRQQVYSVSYLLLSSAEGRKILNENQSLCDLIGENLSENLLKQFVHKDTHEGTLYYLLTSEVGNKILSEYSSLRDKIDPSVLAKQIVDGPNKGQLFRDLYNGLFPNSAGKTISP